MKQVDQFKAVRELNIDSGKITYLQRHVSPRIPELEQEYEGLPPRTVVRIMLSPALSSNINVEIWLPDAGNWNGRFMGLGNGGAAGNINQAAFPGHIIKGYAVAMTDMGTAPSPGSGIDNHEVWKDFGFRATHLMTLAAKKIIAAFYSKQPVYSYFQGSSTGGQQALQEAQRYPDDYDGIISRVPAHCRTPLHAYFLWNYQILQECPFTEEQESNIIAAANEYMSNRELPQTAGKLISDPRCNHEDIEAVIKTAVKKDASLTNKHADALRKLFDGPRHAVTGERIFCGIPLGSAFGPAQNNLYLFNWVFGANQDYMNIDFGGDIDAYTAKLGPHLNAENPDLDSFKQHGGKLIMISGSADSCVPYHATLDYYERVIEHFGDIEQVGSFFRYYIIPGMEHGMRPIDRLPDFIDLLVKWREENVVPDTIQLQRVIEDKTDFDIPVQPYPGKTVPDEEREFGRITGLRGGVERVSGRFLPAAAR